jgi:hypothetical protein
MNDEIVRGMCITRDGEVVHEATRKAMGLDAPPPAPEPPATPPDAATAPATNG